MPEQETNTFFEFVILSRDLAREEKTVQDVVDGLLFFVLEVRNQTGRNPSGPAVGEYYSHLMSEQVVIHRQTLQNDVAKFVQRCLSQETYEIKALRESQGVGLRKENVERGRELCANEPGCE